jgi:hypothetical protein
LLRSTVWAAQKEPAARIQQLSLQESVVGTDRSEPVAATVRLAVLPGNASIRWQLRNDAGNVVQSGAADLAGDTASFAIPVSQRDGGRYLVDVFLLSGEVHADWASAPLRIEPPVGLTTVAADPFGRVRRSATPRWSSRSALPGNVSLVM